MYYLFIPKKRQEEFLKEFNNTKLSIDRGVTPVYSELRSARNNLLEALPHYLLQGVFLIIGTVLLSKVNINDTIKIALVLLVNGLCSTISYSIFVFIKHYLRKRTLIKLGLEVSEKNISVLESLEYQSV